jgi:hypothetical protein
VRLSLAGIREQSYGSKFRYKVYHPRYWEQKKDTDNRFHTLYFSAEIVDEWEADRKSRRKNIPKRYWVRKKGNVDGHWKYRYRHAKEEVPILGLSKEVGSNSSYYTESVVKKKYVSDFDISNPPTVKVEHEDAGKENARKVVTGAQASYRRGGKAQGRTYIIRREIFDLLQRDENLLHSSVITPEQLKKNRGKLRKVTILMPDFSLAIKQLLLREEQVKDKMESTGLLLNIKKEFPSPIDILNLFPHRGPFSGESRHLITKILNTENSHIKEFDDELQALIDVTWRSILSKLLEMNYWHRKNLPEEVVEEAAEETNRCEECDSTEMIIDDKKEIIFCDKCGHLHPFLPTPHSVPWKDVENTCEECNSMKITIHLIRGERFCEVCGWRANLPPEADPQAQHEAEVDAKNPL